MLKLEAYLEPCQTSMTELFCEMFTTKTLTILQKSSIVDIRLGSKYAFKIKYFSITGTRILNEFTHFMSLICFYTP